jgi:hypothetical protein
MARNITLALAALSMIALLSPASAGAKGLNDAYAHCDKVAHETWGYSSDGGKDRMREFVFNACVANGGEMPH